MMNKQKQQKESGSQWHCLGNRDGLEIKNWFLSHDKSNYFPFVLKPFWIGFCHMKVNKIYWHILFKHLNTFSVFFNPRKTFFKPTCCFSGVSLTLIKDRLELVKFHSRKRYQKFFFFHSFWALYPLSKICKKENVSSMCFKRSYMILLLAYLLSFSSSL